MKRRQKKLNVEISVNREMETDQEKPKRLKKKILAKNKRH